MVKKAGRISFNKITPQSLKDKKTSGQKIVMMSAYSCGLTRIIDSTESVDAILVSDASVGMLCLGYASALPVTLEEMLHHTKAVSRANPRALVVADMPYLTYEVSPIEAARNAGRLVKEGAANAVRVKGAGQATLRSIGEIIQAKAPVMGTLNPSASKIQVFSKTFKTQPSSIDIGILEEAKRLQEAGCFALVLEDADPGSAKQMASQINIPVIGLNSGNHCDGQLVITEDLFGLTQAAPKKAYVNLARAMAQAVRECAGDITRNVY